MTKLCTTVTKKLKDKRALFILLCLPLLDNCKSTEKALSKNNNALSKSRQFNKIYQSRDTLRMIEFSRVAITYKSEKNKFSSTATIRSIRDSFLNITLQKLALPLFNLLFTPDSVQAISYWKKEYYSLPYDTLSNLINYPVSLLLLESIIYADVSYLETPYKMKRETNKNDTITFHSTKTKRFRRLFGYSIERKRKEIHRKGKPQHASKYSNQFVLDKVIFINQNQLLRAELINPEQQLRIHLHCSKHKQTEQGTIPIQRKYSLLDAEMREMMTLTMNIKKIKTNKLPRLMWKIPKTYPQKRISKQQKNDTE